MENLELIDPSWTNESIEKILKKLDTSKDGLSTKEANNRISKYGYNELPVTKKNS